MTNDNLEIRPCAFFAALLLGFLTVLNGPAVCAQVDLLSRGAFPAATAGGDSTLATLPGDLGQSRVSADGRFVVFVSRAANLAPTAIDANDATDVYLHDVVQGSTRLVSHAAAPADHAGNGRSRGPSISADGRFVAFESSGTDLAAGTLGDGFHSNVFLYDRLSDAITLVSHAAGAPNVSGSGSSGAAAVSADGRYVAFLSGAGDLVAGQVDAGGSDVFLFDRSTGTNTLVSHAAGLPTTAAGASLNCVVSDDGGAVAYESTAPNLVPGQVGASGSVFVYDRASGASSIASHALQSPQEAVSASLRAISGDGRYVLFQTEAPGLSPSEPDDAMQPDLYRFDRQTGANLLVTREYYLTSVWEATISRDGRFVAYATGHIKLFDALTETTVQIDRPRPGSPFGDDGASHPRISADGRWVAYVSQNPYLVDAQIDQDLSLDVFVYDRTTDVTALVSHQPSNALLAMGYGRGGGIVNEVAISGDGSLVAFETDATNLVAGDINWHDDVFAYVRATGVVSTVSRRGAPSISANRDSEADLWSAPARDRSMMSADGRFALFMSRATNLLAGQAGEAGGESAATFRPSDVFLRDRVAGTTTLVSHAVGSAVTRANGLSENASLSTDGRVVVYTSEATNLVAGPAPYPQGLYAFDRDTGVNTLVAAFADDPDQGPPSMSADGRFVAFASAASNLVPGQLDGNLAPDVFLYDRTSNSVSLVSHLPGLFTTTAPTGGSRPSISADGQRIALTGSKDLVPGATGGGVLVFDRLSGERRLASHKVGAALDASPGASPSISRDGAYVLYYSYSTEIVSGDPGYAFASLFLYEYASGTNIAVSRPSAQGDATFGLLSADGRFVAYESKGEFEVPGVIERNLWVADIYLFDRVTGSRVLVSHLEGSPLATGNGAAALRGFSPDGRYVFCRSAATDIVAGQIAGDTLVYDRITALNWPLWQWVGAHHIPIDFASSNLDASQILFSSTSSTLADGDFNDRSDAFVFGVTPTADVALQIVAPARANPGQDITFTISVSNIGRQPADGVQLLFGPIYSIGPASVSGACASLPCALGTLAVGEVRHVSATYTIPLDYGGPSPIVGSGGIMTASPDADPGNDRTYVQVSLPSLFYTLAPCRVLDSRQGSGPFGGPAIPAGLAGRTLTLPGACGIPAGVKSVAVNVTVVDPPHHGHVRLRPSDMPLAESSTVNFAPRQTRANNAVIAVGPGGRLDILVAMNGGEAHVILDVVGYFK